MTESGPADRALRALGDAVGVSRPRRPEDGTDPEVPVAATVVLVRDGVDGPEVLLIERPDRGSFAGAWVFPGGRIEASDLVPDGGEADAARVAAVRETHEETGLHVDADALVELSVWDPPPGLALRIRTWFFVAPHPGAPLALAADEAVAAMWARPRDVLARHAEGELTLYPPTWVTLHSLSRHAEADALVRAARERGLERFETVARRGETGPILLWQDDAEYDDEGAAEASARHRLELGSLPWEYTRRR